MTGRDTSTNRRLTDSAQLETLVFDDAGLIPVVAQDAGTGNVLMVAWANREAIEKTLATGTMHYWSRSRSELWKKGETSGNTQTLDSLHTDCDSDTLLARVRPAGPACHTGDTTCFGLGSTADDGGSVSGPNAEVLSDLWAVLEERDRERPEGSYTTKLLEDQNLRVKKLGEEMAELVSALVQKDESLAEEAADLVYHLMVALKGAGRNWSEVVDALAERRR